MPGIGEVMLGAMQHAPQPVRHSMLATLPSRTRGASRRTAFDSPQRIA
jgi:hypothetical protein